MLRKKLRKKIRKKVEKKEEKRKIKHKICMAPNQARYKMLLTINYY